MRAWIRWTTMAAAAVPLALAVAGSTTSRPIAEAGAAVQAGTVERRAALRRAWLARAHPQWRTLSAAGRAGRLALLGGRAMRRAATAAAGSADVPAPVAAASFQGNLTLIQGPSGGAIDLQRQADCSVSYSVGTYTPSLTAPAFHVDATTADYQDVLHAAAGLDTTADTFPHGCADATIGVGSRRGFYLGRTNRDLYMFAATGYNYTTGGDSLYTNTVDAPTDTLSTYDVDSAVPDSVGMVAGDLDGDGLADIVVLDRSAGAVVVRLAHPDGTIGAPTRVAAAGTRTLAAVMADVDGDGQLDVVVAGTTFNATTQRDEQSIAVLLGHGDGTLAAARTFPVASPTSGVDALLTSLVAVDLRGTGKPDLVGSNGLVLLNDGSGGFSPAGAWGFPTPMSNNVYGPNLVAGDFDEDGRPDIAVNDGARVLVYLGRGDGSFSAGRVYANSDSVGYLSAGDLDGDGHLDLYVGLANGGFFGGDQYGVNRAYVLMGRGDGSFAGAPVLPFVNTGHNMADLDGDGTLDGVGVGADRSFTTWAGDGHGGFAARTTLPVATITLGSESFPLNDIDSFDLADVDGDGAADLVFLGSGFTARNSSADFDTPGFLIARGDGHAGLAPPRFLPAPSFVPAGDIDIDLVLDNVRLADVDGDGRADLVYGYADTSYQTHQRVVGLAVQRGNGDGSFQPPATFFTTTGLDDGTFIGFAPQVQQFADLNHDGRLDLILITPTPTLDHEVGGYQAELQVALGHGDGSFAAPVTVGGPEVPPNGGVQGESAPIVVADMDGDGVPDLVTLGGSAGYDLQIAIARGNGDGSFQAPVRTTLAAQFLGGDQQLAVADFNADGKPDVLVANPYGTTGIVFGNGDGTLAPLGSAGAATPNLVIDVPIGGAARVVDFNADGRPDVIAGNVLLLSMAATAAVPGDFTLAADNAAATLTAGQSVPVALAVTPGAGYAGTVTFSCSGLPVGATCVFAPPSVTVGGAAASTLTLSTTGATLAALGRIPGLPGLPGGLAIAGLGLVLVRRRDDTAQRRRAGLAALLAAIGLAQIGCSNSVPPAPGDPGGGGGATPAGSYTVIITATDGHVSHSLDYVLNAQ